MVAEQEQRREGEGGSSGQWSYHRLKRASALVFDHSEVQRGAAKAKGVDWQSLNNN